MATKKYIVKVDADKPFKCDATSEELYLTPDGMYWFFKSSLNEMEEITETPEEAYRRGYREGYEKGLNINKDLSDIEYHVNELVKLYEKIFTGGKNG